MDKCSLSENEMIEYERSIKKAIYFELLKKGAITESDLQRLLFKLSAQNCRP